jgi:hypothetical protein
LRTRVRLRFRSSRNMLRLVSSVLTASPFRYAASHAGQPMNLANWIRQPTTMIGLAGMIQGVSTFVATGCHDLPTLGGTAAASAVLLVINDNTALRGDVGQTASDFTKMATAHTVDMATVMKDTISVLKDIEAGGRKADAEVVAAAAPAGAAPSEVGQDDATKVMATGVSAGALAKASCLIGVFLGAGLALAACTSSGGPGPTVAADITGACAADAAQQPTVAAAAQVVAGAATVAAPATASIDASVAAAVKVDNTVVHPAIQKLCSDFSAGVAATPTPATTSSAGAASTPPSTTN